MFINIHIIQNFPASNLNRDDTGAPKDTIFGGVRRARISSQCQKRSIRTHRSFADTILSHGGDLGVRTKRLSEAVVGRLVENDKEENEAKKAFEALLNALGLKTDKKGEKTQYLLYLGNREIEEMVEFLLKYWEEAKEGELAKEPKKEPKKELKSIVKERKKNSGYAADIALFGRMVADSKEMNVDAACQVAHAISTHKTALETDYYTAVDDLLPDDESGSDMIGVVEYNGACYYRYANINLEKLKENLGRTNEDLLAATVLGFIKAMVMAIPTGMQNSFAAQSYPAYVKVTALDMPISYANAFSKPVRNREDESIEEKSTAALKNFEERQLNFLGKTPVWEAEASLFEKDKTIASLLQEVETKLTEE